MGSMRALGGGSGPRYGGTLPLCACRKRQIVPDAAQGTAPKLNRGKGRGQVLFLGAARSANDAISICRFQARPTTLHYLDRASRERLSVRPSASPAGVRCSQRYDQWPSARPARDTAAGRCRRRRPGRGHGGKSTTPGIEFALAELWKSSHENARQDSKMT